MKHTPPGGRRRAARLVRLLISCTLALTAIGATQAGSVAPAGAATGPTSYPWADPDTVPAGTRYVTIGTSVSGTDLCGTANGSGRRWVPYAVHGNGEYIGMNGLCAEGDVMPGGPGSWADASQDIWAPTMVYYGGRWILYYTALRAGTGQRCIGKAEASSARGPFGGQTMVICPGGGRWAIDPDAFVDNNALYLTWRDDSITSLPQTGLSVQQMATNGFPTGAKRPLLVSTAVSWEYVARTNTNVIENPSMMRINTTGRMYLFFSGHDYASRRYSTGVADCGTNVVASAFQCTVMGSTAVPYFGWNDTDPPDEDLNPLYGLPQNHGGPGGMSLFRTHGGAARAVWHFSFFNRYAIAGELAHDGTTFSVT